MQVVSLQSEDKSKAPRAIVLDLAGAVQERIPEEGLLLPLDEAPAPLRGFLQDFLLSFSRHVQDMGGVFGRDGPVATLALTDLMMAGLFTVEDLSLIHI